MQPPWIDRQKIGLHELRLLAVRSQSWWSWLLAHHSAPVAFGDVNNRASFPLHVRICSRKSAAVPQPSLAAYWILSNALQVRCKLAFQLARLQANHRDIATAELVGHFAVREARNARRQAEADLRAIEKCGGHVDQHFVRIDPPGLTASRKVPALLPP